MPIEIEGTQYLSATEVAEQAGVSRQTLWRWRREAKIPSGHRYRDRQIVFTPDEVAEITAYANRIEPIASGARGQRRLFTGPS